MDLLGSTYAQYLIRLVFAAFIGALIGIERESKGKPAGMRTNVLMCMGSCLIMILSVEVAENAGPPADPARIAAQVVTGIGFLGAGMIIRSRVSVTGLTSAATLWFVAAVGLAIGYGTYLLAAFASLLGILTLTTLDRIEKRMAVSRQLHILRLRVKSEGDALLNLRNVLQAARITPDDIDLKREEGWVRLDIEYISRDQKHRALMAELEGLVGVDVLLHY